MAIYQDYSKKRKKYKSNMDGYGMIREDIGKPANLPQDVKIKMYPKSYSKSNGNGGINDSAKGIDQQIKADRKNRKKGNKKY